MMPVAATRADALRFKVGESEITHLIAAGGIPGVIVKQAAAKNGAGIGRLRSAGDGTLLSWKAPGSAVWGDAYHCHVDEQEYVLEDGEDHDKFVRVQIAADFLTPGSVEALVYLQEVYNNGIASDDVSAAEASAGDVETYQITMENVGSETLQKLVVWLDPGVSGLEISENGSSWVNPTTEETALAFPDLPAGQTDILHVRRTIGAGAEPDPAVLSCLHARFVALW